MKFDTIYDGLIKGTEKLALVGLGYVGMPIAVEYAKHISVIGFDGLDRSIDARISRLRRKLGDDPENPTRIKTVRGKGYLFSKHDWQ